MRYRFIICLCAFFLLGSAPIESASAADLNILLDASGSQAASLSELTTSKFDMQKNALTDVLIQLKNSETIKNTGLRVFGSAKPLDQHDCKDTVQLYPIAPLDIDAIQKAFSGISAQGESPQAMALEAASKDFRPGMAEDQVIVLITDGSDTCGVDACQTARALHSVNPKLIINVVGFDLTQEDEAKVKCIALSSDGKFFLARNETELRNAIDDAVSGAGPYNFRVMTLAGATPIPTRITVIKSATGETIKNFQSFGTKSLYLPAGTYDILAEYLGSPELKKPSKIVKGVEILTTSKTEQQINFELGFLTLSAIDTGGVMTRARYQILKSPLGEKFAQIEADAVQQSIFLSPGTYDIIAEQADSPEKITLTEQAVEIKSGAALEKIFRFQKGTLVLKGVTSQNTAIPFVVQIYKANAPDQLIASSAMGAEGGEITLSPGAYDLLLTGWDSSLLAFPRTKVTAAQVSANQSSEITAAFEMGTLKLSATDGQGKPMLASFSLINPVNKEEIAKIAMQDAKTPVVIYIPPGKYDVIAYSQESKGEPKPTVTLSNVEITTATPAEKAAIFVFGTMRLRGRNAKEQPINTKFSVYKSGTDELVALDEASSDWHVFQIEPGRYDVKAENILTEELSAPSLWIKDILVEDSKQISHEAIFTAGKLKIIGRGPNNKIITCHFKIYKYGSDRELINGETADDWQVFDIDPGPYYLEAGYVDPEASVLLKKWINVNVEENEVVELILRF